MFFILCAILYVFIDSRSPVTMVQTVPVMENVAEIEKRIDEGIQVIDVHGNTESGAAPKRIKRLDSIETEKSSSDSQKLIFFPSRTLKPPKMHDKQKTVNSPHNQANHRMSSKPVSLPRPFNHEISTNSQPNGFRKPKSTARSFQTSVNSIQDVIQQNRPQLMSPFLYGVAESSTRPLQLAGTYRHPRKNGELLQLLNMHEAPPSPNEMEMISDPFRNFKPNSPLEINQMAINGMRYVNTVPTQAPYFRRKFRQQVASIPNYNLQSADVTNIYQNVLSTGRRFKVDRNEENRHKPLSMMLDVFPMNGEVQETHQLQINPMHLGQGPMHPMRMTQAQQPARVTGVRPFQGFYQDPNVFNSMHFPQLSQRQPYYMRYAQAQTDASNLRFQGMSKPSQLIVHLNLFPKGSKSAFKRSSTEDQIQANEIQPKISEKLRKNTTEVPPAPVNINFNVNTNGHPENIRHQLNLSREPLPSFNVSKETSNQSILYYDENEENESDIDSPSRNYYNIHRDRPFHLKLKNSTKVADASKDKLMNHKNSYHTIERPKKHAIKNEPRKRDKDKHQVM